MGQKGRVLAEKFSIKQNTYEMLQTYKEIITAQEKQTPT
jgi:hypothetical protein